MPEKNQTPIEMLDQNTAVVQSAEVPAPAAPIQLQQRQSYAEKVQGLTVDERNWMLAKSKAAAMAQLPAGFLPLHRQSRRVRYRLRDGPAHGRFSSLRHAEPLRRPWYAHMERQELQGPHRQQRPVCRPHPLPHGGRRRHRQLGLPPDRRGQAHRRKGRRSESHGQDGKGCRVVEQEW